MRVYANVEHHSLSDFCRQPLLQFHILGYLLLFMMASHPSLAHLFIATLQALYGLDVAMIHFDGSRVAGIARTMTCTALS